MNVHVPLRRELDLQHPAHGYLIMSRVEQMSGGQVKLAPGTLYGALANLLKQGLIAQLDSDDPRRKVYQITPPGAQLLAADTQRMAHIVSVFNSGCPRRLPAVNERG